MKTLTVKKDALVLHLVSYMLCNVHTDVLQQPEYKDIFAAWCTATSAVIYSNRQRIRRKNTIRMGVHQMWYHSSEYLTTKDDFRPS